MIKHSILDSNGVKVGEVELPDDASQIEIDAVLAKLSPHAPEEIIPDVTARQIRQAIVMSGLATIAEVESALDGLPEPIKTLAQIEWEYSTEFQRKRPLVMQVVAMLGLSPEQADSLWKFAATLK